MGDWFHVCLYVKFTIEFIHKYKEKIIWSALMENKNNPLSKIESLTYLCMNKDFILFIVYYEEKFKKQLLPYILLSDDIIKGYIKKLI